MDLEHLLNKQKIFFNTNITKEVSYRINILNKLEKEIIKREDEIFKALYKDMSKTSFEAYATEIGIIYKEIKYMKSHLKKFSRKRKCKSPLIHFPSKSFVYNEPYGTVLIISPWNYPFQLTMIPLIGVIATGNTAILKLSKTSVESNKVITKILSIFDEEYIKVLDNVKFDNDYILDQKYDYIFFTGSPSIGKKVLEKASKNLIPTTLELGGKSPCIVCDDFNIDLAAKRIVWGKLLNAGQTCVAPDYIYVKSNVKKKLIKSINKYIEEFYTKEPHNNKEYPKIINEQHYNRLIKLANNTNKVNKKEQKISPVILDNVTWEDDIMKEEIFGPIFPILTFDDITDVITVLKTKEKPLATYLFTNNKVIKNLVMHSLSSGGLCINDVLIHISNSNLPFGGIGNSGMNSYHGKYSYELFSHKKSIMQKSKYIDIIFRYAPFKNKLKLLRKLM